MAIISLIVAAGVLVGCAAPDRRGSPAREARVAGTVLARAGGYVELSFSRMRPLAARVLSETESRPTDADIETGTPVAAAARRVLLDLRQAPQTRAGDLLVMPVATLRPEIERLLDHVAAAWHFDFDPAVVAFMRVRLRAAIAPDGAVRSIELLDSHGGPEEILARFVEDAIATLDWSSPLPLPPSDAGWRALVFRFEAGRAPR